MSLLRSSHLRIVYWRLSGFHGEDQFIGGIETYIHLLAECCSDIGMPVTLYQCAERPFQRMIGPLTVKGIQTAALRNTAEAREKLSRAAFDELDFKHDILIYAADEWSVKTAFPRAMLIQHGISWDVPIRFPYE